MAGKGRQRRRSGQGGPRPHGHKTRSRTWSLSWIVWGGLVLVVLGIGSQVGFMGSQGEPGGRSTAPDPTGRGSPQRPEDGGEVRRFAVRVLGSYPHDPTAYTQGLLWYQDSVFESTGKYGQSTLRQWDLGSGQLRRSLRLPGHQFGEGLARVGNRLIQLTWKEQVALVYDLGSFKTRGRMRYQGEGWGLCFDGQTLAMSDGSHVLTFRDPETFAPLRRLEVKLRGEPVENLNELEWAEGWIYANVWTTDTIVRIDPESGRVTGTIDASGLLDPAEQQAAEVLNGIAYKPESETFLLTGKFWPRIFEVAFVPSE